METQHATYVNGIPPILESQRSTPTLAALEAPFPEETVRWVVKATAKQQTRKGTVDRGFVLPYVDCRQYADRLNEVAGLGQWTRKYQVHVVEGVEKKYKTGDQVKTAKVTKIVVSCELTITGLGIQTGLGEEWADDDNAATSAEAQAFKRACSMFGVGRYLYDIEGRWVDLDHSKRPVGPPALPDWAKPADQRQPRNSLYRQELIAELTRLCGLVGAGLAASILKHSVNVTEPAKVRDLTKVPQAIERLQNAARGVERLRAAAERAGEEKYQQVCQALGVGTEVDSIPDTATLRNLIDSIESDLG